MDKPNIILFNCDDLGYGDLGCYGSTVNRTPALDRMAAEGIRFTDFYMASPVCSPSRGAMMTGCYPPRISFGEFGGGWVLFPGQPYGIHADEKTLPQLLKDQGYSTKLIGKWHCGDQPEFLPTNRGFDEYYGLPYSNDMGRQAGRENQMPPLPLIRDDEVIQEQPDQCCLTERYTEEAVKYLREQKDGPFFLYFAHMYVHVPIFVPRRFKGQSANGGYGDAVEHIDWTTEVIFDELKRLGIDDNTIVIFTSDNGSRARDEGGSNAPLRGTKGTTWEGGQRVPFIVRWPAKIRGGQTCSEVVSSIDILPTLVGQAGGEVPVDRTLDGVDISPLLFAEGGDAPRDTFLYYKKNGLEAIRKGPWKLHVNKDGEAIQELYNLESDVGESSNVYGANPEVVEQLAKLAEEARKDLGDEHTQTVGSGIRPKGEVENPKPLTEYNEDHPYMIAMYDLADTGVMAG
ncbi:MAG: sulfatase family protein [Planctomycetota bacterium]|jgi:arylsulfatase A-like enzyme